MIVCDIIISIKMSTTTYYHCYFYFSKSFVSNFNHVCFWHPQGFFDDFCASLSACFVGVPSGKRMKYPYQASLLFFTILLQGDTFVLSYNALLQSFSGHLMFKIFRSTFLDKRQLYFLVFLLMSKVHSHT